MLMIKPRRWDFLVLASSTNPVLREVVARSVFATEQERVELLIGALLQCIQSEQRMLDAEATRRIEEGRR